MKKIALAFLLTIAAPVAAQQSLLQAGPTVQGHVPRYTQSFGQPVVIDSGPASGGGPGIGLTELGLTVLGSGNPPYANAGTGPFGTNICDFDAPVTNPTGYHFYCGSPNAQSGGLLAFGAGGIAPLLGFNLLVNGHDAIAVDQNGVVSFPSGGPPQPAGSFISVTNFSSIQAGINYVGSIGGGILWFPAGYTATITAPLNLLNGVHLKGPCSAPTPGSTICARLSAGADLTSIVTQADLTTPLTSVGIEGLVFDGVNGTFTVGNIINLSAINSYIINSYVANGTGNCIKWTANSTAAWINWFEGNTIGNCAGIGLNFQGSDSKIIGNYISGNGIGVQANDVAIVSSNQIEDNQQYGLVLVANSHAGIMENINTVTGNLFTQNNKSAEGYSDIYIQNSGGSPSACKAAIVGNIFHATAGNNIIIENNCQDGLISGNTFSENGGTTAEIVWGGTGNTGWTIGTNSYYQNTANRFSNLPVDATLINGSGVGGSGAAGTTAAGMYSYLIIGNGGTTVADTQANIYGSNTVLGEANTAIRVGVARNYATLDAALTLGVLTGNTPFIGSDNGETTVASPLEFHQNGTRLFGLGHVLSVSEAVFTDDVGNLVSNALSGTGNVVMSSGATLSSPILATPSQALTTWTDTQACTAGQIVWDASYIYVCTAANTVKRAALSTF